MSRSVWDEHWEKLLEKPNVFGYILSIVRYSVLSNYLRYLTNKHFHKKGIYLEAGAGTSQSSFGLSKFCRHYIALDYSIVALDAARKIKVIDTFIAGDIYSLPFADNSLNGIWNIGVMEHFKESDLIKIYNEFARVLKKGGRLIVLIPPVYASHIILLFPIEMVISKLKGKKFSFFPEELSRLKGRNHIVSLLDKTDLSLVDIEFSWKNLFFFCAVVAEKRI